MLGWIGLLVARLAFDHVRSCRSRTHARSLGVVVVSPVLMRHALSSVPITQATVMPRDAKCLQSSRALCGTRHEFTVVVMTEHVICPPSLLQN